MIDKLKTFVGKNREKFDSNEPSKSLWEKIDTRLEVKSSSSISSEWLKKFKYFGLSATVLVIAVYFISQKLNNSSSNELAQTTKDSATSNSEEWVKANQNRSEINESENNLSNSDNVSNKLENSKLGSPSSSSNVGESKRLISDSLVSSKRDSIVNNVSNQNKIKSEDAVRSLPKEENANINLAKNKKKIETQASEESLKINSYSCTILNGSSFCSAIRAYKFPGQVSMKGTMTTIGCSKLESVSNLKAVYLKGKTAKRITLSLKEGFKNIVLEKADGRKLTPEAISHYYTGLGVITGYTGKYFDLTFKNKVELILFFKDVEDGDKIIIDNTIEAIVKN